MLIRDISANEIVSMISQSGFHFDLPNLQDNCSMASSRMVLQIGDIA